MPAEDTTGKGPLATASPSRIADLLSLMLGTGKNPARFTLLRPGIE